MTPNYTTRNLTIPAGGSTAIVREGEFVTCLEASALFEMRIDQGPKMDFEAGLSLAVQTKFQRVDLLNPTAEDITVKLGIGKGSINDAHLFISGTVGTREETPGGFATRSPVNLGNGASTPVLPVNLARSEAILVNTGTAVVFIQGNAGTAGQGVPLDAGQSLTLETTAAIWGRNDTGGAVALSVAELGRF